MKVNLEKELLQQNKKIASPAELLLLKEYDRLGDAVADNDTLARVGMNIGATEGKKVKNKIDGLKAGTSGFNQDRVFHVSQIRNLCEKYYLRFLNVKRYNGSVDEQLAGRISQFEIAYGQECNKENCFIVAPKQSFKLEERPKDPLFFYQINEEYYYLIHKWGNDLSIFRRLLAFYSKTNVSVASIWLVLWPTAATLFFVNESADAVIGADFLMFFSVMITIPFFVENAAFVGKNKWDSEDL